MRAMLENLGQTVTAVEEERIDEMIHLADKNGDGKVDFEEFCAVNGGGEQE